MTAIASQDAVLSSILDLKILMVPFQLRLFCIFWAREFVTAETRWKCSVTPFKCTQPLETDHR